MGRTIVVLGILLATTGIGAASGHAQQKTPPAAASAPDAPPAPNPTMISPGLAAERRVAEVEQELRQVRLQLAACQGQVTEFLVRPANAQYEHQVKTWCEKLAKEQPGLACNDQGQVVPKEAPSKDTSQRPPP